MNGDITLFERADLEWLLELQNRALPAFVNENVRESMEWGDVKSAAWELGYRGEFIDESVFSAKPSGLVSDQTSGSRVRPKTTTPFRVKADLAVMLETGDWFVPDPVQGRLMRLRRSVGFAARTQAVHAAALSTDEALMVTLTYRRSNDDWDARHISDFLRHARTWSDARGIAFRYVWVAELQKRGVIHYHVALWVPIGVRFPKPDLPRRAPRLASKRTNTDGPWSSLRDRPWWPHGMTRIEVARAAVPYLLKYLSKDTSKTFGRFPKGARIYGIGGLEYWARLARRWLGLPKFIQAHASIDDRWKRAEGGGWCDPAGTWHQSEFVREKVGVQPVMRRVHTHPKQWAPDGPFSWRTGAFAALRGPMRGNGERPSWRPGSRSSDIQAAAHARSAGAAAWVSVESVSALGGPF